MKISVVIEVPDRESCEDCKYYMSVGMAGAGSMKFCSIFGSVENEKPCPSCINHRIYNNRDEDMEIKCWERGGVNG